MPAERSRRRGRPVRYAFAAVTALVALVVLVALSGQRRIEAQPPIRPLATEGVPADGALRPPVQVDFPSRGNRLTGFLFLPSQPARAPLMVYNHGSEQDPDLKWLGDVGRFYQSHGFAVLFPWRQGCSGSGGTFWRERFPMPGDEQDARLVEERTVRALQDELQDVLAAVAYARALPSVDPARTYVGGSSFGGLLALMAVGAIPEVKGAVICSGAAWAYGGSTAAGQTKLEELARAAKAPSFFMQAKNDYNPGASEALGGIMSLAGLPHVAKIYPRFGTTQVHGHAGFCNKGSSVWGDDVLAFLKGE